MKKVSVFEAKTKFSGLINHVLTSQEEVAITKHGHEVAKIIPIKTLRTQEDRRKAIEDIEMLSREIGESKIGLKEIRDMRAEGRR